MLSLLRQFDFSTQESSQNCAENHGLGAFLGLACSLPSYMCHEKPVLKISLIDGRTQRRLVLEGKLIAPWAAELKSVCVNARADLRGRELILELKHITTISQEGENVLLQLMTEGTTIRCCGDVFTKHVLKQLSRRARRSYERK